LDLNTSIKTLFYTCNTWKAWDFAVKDHEYMISGDLSKLSFGRDAKGLCPIIPKQTQMVSTGTAEN
jgi:hypothetical protein